MENRNLESLEIVAKYMGAEIKNYSAGETEAYYPNGFPDTRFILQAGISNLKYDKSWDWLIPVWQKVALELKEIVSRREITTKDYEWDFWLLVGKDIENAVFCNDIQKAFETVIKTISFVLDYNSTEVKED